MSAVRSQSNHVAARHEARTDWWTPLIVGLFLTRFFVPAEGAAEGHSLWIALPWLILFAGRLWWHWRNGERPGVRLNRLDIAALLLVGSHCVSALAVVGTGGDRRAALNSFWEWISLAATGFLLKETLLAPRNRLIFTSALLASVITLSALGIWQHVLWYPQQAREVTELLDLHARITAGESLEPAERSRFQQLVRRHGSAVLTYDATARQSFLARIKDSSEPIGRFALANTFATLLCAGTMLLLGTLIDRLADPLRRRHSTTWQLALFLLPVLVCLLLTKSRTAYLALAVALAAKVWLTFGGSVLRRITARQWMMAVVVAFAVLAAGVGALTAWGGLDKEVLTEAPKSLGYRWEYWQATAGVIREHPWLGVGPGNYRQHYLKFKLPGASEEILDPHNLLLDVWANAGIVALLALGAIIVISFHRSIPAGESFAASPIGGWATLPAAGAFALLAVFAQSFFFEGTVDEQVLILLSLWIPLAMGLQFTLRSDPVTSTTAQATVWSLWVGLLAAGGIGMPAIAQTIWALLLLIPPSQSGAMVPTAHRPLWLFAAAFFGLLAAGCLWTGLKPVIEAAQHMALGENELVLGQPWRNAQRQYEAASLADPLSPEPHHRLGEMSHWVWQQSGHRDTASFDRAIAALEQSIAKDPLAPKRKLILARWWFEHWQVDNEATALKRSLVAFREAAEGYPHFAPIQAGLAIALAASGDRSAADAARRALDLDDLNRVRGHTDKLLPPAERQQLEQIAGTDPGNGSPPPP